MMLGTTTGRSPHRSPSAWPPLLFAVLMLGASPFDAFAQNAAAGRAKAQACIPCHGQFGISTQPDAPHLASQPEIYLAQQLKAYRSGRRTHEVMSVMAKPLKDADIADLAAWFASIEISAQPPR